MATKYYAHRPLRYRKKYYRPGDEITGFTSIWGYRRMLHTAQVLAASTVGAPTDLNAIGIDETTAQVYLVLPAEDPHAPTLRYEWTLDNGSNWNTAEILVDGDGLTYFEVGELDWTQNYTFKVRGVNKVGNGTTSAGDNLSAWD